MNSLSWIFYLIGFFSNLSGVLVTFIVISGICMGLHFMWVFLSKAEGDTTLTYLPIWNYIVWALFAFIATAIPDQRTMYLIAASEVGEMTLQTEEAQILYKDLKTIIGKYANGE